MSRHPRRAVAQETVAILDQGDYVAPSGHAVSIAGDLARSVDGTVLHTPSGLDELLAALPSGPDFETRIEVTGETTLAAAKRLGEPGCVPFALNFASAKNPGGGFLNGAQAQEEGLARSSGLYASQRAARAFYEFH
ncbi:TIGR02452 family protein, partial [Actinomadura adrarensis]